MKEIKSMLLSGDRDTILLGFSLLNTPEEREEIKTWAAYTSLEETKTYSISIYPSLFNTLFNDYRWSSVEVKHWVETGIAKPW